MEYRRLGRTGLQVSAISLGTEYLIDVPRDEVASVIHAAIAGGINYFDLFWPQPAFRDNMALAFQDHRQECILAAHLGAGVDRTGQYEKTRDLQRSEHFFHDFLTRYHTDVADLLFLHNIDEQDDYRGVMGPGGLLELAQRLRSQGKARYIGLSSHTVATALQAVESGYIDVLMFPINLGGHAVPGRQDLFHACVARDVGLVAMKPFAGGKLLEPGSTLAIDHYRAGGEPLELTKTGALTPVQCLAYVLAQPGVSTIVPGCANLAELATDLSYWRSSPEARDFSAVVSDFRHYASGECVYCNHCLPCPSLIDIGHTIRLLEMAQKCLSEELRAAYRALPADASNCVQCGSCTQRCPFGVDVIAKMDQAAALFA